MSQTNTSRGNVVTDAGATVETQAILQRERERYQAMLAGDVSKLDELLSPHLVYTHASTRRDTKESYLERIGSGFYKYLTLSATEEQVVVIGSTALVTGRLTTEVVVNQMRRTLNNMVLGVWVREDAGWRFVAYQPTPLP